MTTGNKPHIAIIGLGYVGLPLALQFAAKYAVIGFDRKSRRIEEINNYYDCNGEVEAVNLKDLVKKKNNPLSGLFCTDHEGDIQCAKIYIITVPTPIDEQYNPNLSYLIDALKTVSKYIQKGDTIIIESTVYPGCTEEVCIPLVETCSGLRINKDFYVGYSPERINPGDKVHTLSNVKKITSGSSPVVAKRINDLYKSVIQAGTYQVSSIKIAEAAKSIENVQRDVNISFVNEIAMLFDKLNIDTTEVLDAASTKWNFLPFKPGIVGGHCISVDPYYLTYKASQVGYTPQMILAARQVNENIPVFISSKVIKLMIEKSIRLKGARVLILGFAFKENCADFRNTKVAEIYNELVQYSLNVEVYDPMIDRKEAQMHYPIKFIDSIDKRIKYDGIILAVAHSIFQMINFSSLLKQRSVLYDVKSFLDKRIVSGRL